MPGVYLQEEEGFGLRPNIGIRGSGLDRSARIALLEDGILIAPAPYSAPSAYYFPTQRRMNSLEILKGPASVAIGPRTTGGAINMISTPIPDAMGVMADVRFGEHSTQFCLKGQDQLVCRMQSLATHPISEGVDHFQGRDSRRRLPGQIG